MSSSFFDEIDRRKRSAIGEQKQNPLHSSTTLFDVDIEEPWVKLRVNEPVLFLERQESEVDPLFLERSLVAWSIDGQKDGYGRYRFFRPQVNFALTLLSDFILLFDIAQDSPNKL